MEKFGEEGVDKKQLFTKTVTNFARVKYDNSGGLNPVSPAKRGLTLENYTETRSSNPSEWRRNQSAVKEAMPTMKLDVSERAVSVFQPRKIVSDVDQSKITFKKYSNFRNEVSPGTSKADYKHYLDRIVKDKKMYDSNIGNTLNHHNKFIAYKNRELSQRAAALHGNQQQDMVHKRMADQALLKLELENAGRVRVQPDQFNYRSPKKYVSLFPIARLPTCFSVDCHLNVL